MYNAGPRPESAEKFDIGLSYHEELQQKKQTEVANNQAAVELILTQNLALLAAMTAEPATETLTPTDQVNSTSLSPESTGVSAAVAETASI